MTPDHFSILLVTEYIQTFARAKIRFPKGWSHFIPCSSVSVVEFERVYGLVGPYESFQL